MKTYHRIALCIVCGFAWLGESAPSTESPPPDISVATRILDAARAASGGAAWDRLMGLRISYIARANGQVGRFDELDDVATGRFVTHEALPASSSADGFDGVSVWTQGRSGVSYVLGDEDARLGAIDERYRVERGWWFRDRMPASIEAGGARSDPTGDFDLLTITPEGGRPFTLWINQKTHLIDRYVERVAERIQTTHLRDYRPIGGVLVPYVIEDDDETLTVASIKENPVFAQTAFSLPPNPPAASAALTSPVVVPFRLVEGKILVDATINGRGPFACVFDSGGSLLIQPAVLERLHLQTPGASRAFGGGEGSRATQLGTLRSLAIGSAQIGSQAFHSFTFSSAYPTRILAGEEVLQQYVVRLDFDRMQMTLTPPRLFHNPHAGVIVPFHFQDNEPEVIGDVDGIAAALTVDTGDNGSLLLIAPFARRYGFAQRYHARYTYAGRSVTATHGLIIRAGTVSLDGIEGRPVASVTRPVTRISLQEFGFDANRYVSASLGIGILKQFNLTFDYARHELILERNHLYGVPDVFDRTGMRIARNAGHWDVLTVYADGPAARAGIQAGDRIDRINGKAPNAIDNSAVNALTHGPIDSILHLRVAAGGATKTVNVTLRELL